MLRFRSCAGVFLALLASFSVPGFAAPVTSPPTGVKSTFRWITSYDLATSQARKSDKIIMAYFSGSDWDPWTEKLEKEVLSTEAFKTWATEHVIPLQIDFPKEKRVSSITKAQNDQIKLKYNVSKVPIFIFLDPSGAPLMRASYQELRLREEETKGHPDSAIKYLNELLKTRPKDEVLKSQPNYHEAYLFAKKNYAVLVMAITQGQAATVIQQRDALLKDQVYVRFMNHNTIYINMNWPDDTDTSVSAKEFRGMADRCKLTPSPFQIVLYDVPYDKIKARYRSFSLQHVDQLVNNIELQLPHVDYSGGWVTDYHLARTISAQTDRDILMAFTSMDSATDNNWSKKMDEEIFKSDAFISYAKKHFVLLQVDFPTATTQPETLSTQNKMLAEQFSVRGFPLVVVINQKGEKLLESKYMKGGPEFFMKQMIPVIAKDQDRLAALKEKD